MEKSWTETPDAAPSTGRPDGISLRRWFAIYGVYLALVAAPAALLLRGLDRPWGDLFLHPGQFTAPDQQALKLLVLALYLSLCTTFLPLPTTWLVAGLASAGGALGGSVWITALLAASVGAFATGMANTTDYHLFTWMLRHRRVARVRETALYRRSAAWFARRPFWLVAVFNVIPVPVDVVRMLAATGQYPLRRFFAANLVGRFLRYAVVAVAAGMLGARGWVVAVALLGVAVVLGVGRAAASLLRRRRRGGGAGEKL